MESNLENNSFVISSNYEGINLCYLLAAKYRDYLHLNYDKFFAFQTILLEAVQNAISHGNKFDDNLVVFVSIDVFVNCIVIRIEDQGQGFEYNHINDPLETNNLKKECGRGLFFIKQLSDHYEISGNGNVISITLNLV
jgi:serine/threonine-protein kinase RsbW